MIHNSRARHNIGRDLPLVIAGCDHVMPSNHKELRDVLKGFVANGVDVLVVDGGDGTVRDILSTMARHFPTFHPRLTIVPSGKTNALALDLGIGHDWTLARVIDAAVQGRVVKRAPIEIWREGADRAELAGFIFGSGAYVRATQMAQRTHRFGAFNGLAVGLSIIAGVVQTMIAGSNNPWRRGERMRIATAEGDVTDDAQYLVLASTLQAMPLGIKPFGPARSGMKMLRIEAPVRRMMQALPAILGGTDREWLPGAGYHRHVARRIDMRLSGKFILDGEVFEGGDLSLRQGAPIRFVVP